MKLNFKKHVLPAATILAAAVAMPAQASYVCTGNAGPADNSTPYFNGELTDTQCDITEVEAFLGLMPGTIDESLILGSKTNYDDVLNTWDQDQSDLGVLTVTLFTGTTGTWELTGNITPMFFVEKYDKGYDIYTYSGLGISPFSDSWDGLNRGTVGALCKADGGSSAPACLA
jgi:hypothetical protein